MGNEDTTPEVEPEIEDAAVEYAGASDVPDTEDADYIDEQDMTPEDALAIIMSAKPVHQTKRVAVKGRAGMGRVVLTLRSLTDREFKAVRKQSEKPAGNRKDQRAGKKETDDSLFLRLIVAVAVESPKLAAQEVLQAHRVTTPDQLVEKLFLPGVIGALAEEVMELSGWDTESVISLGESSGEPAP